MKSMNQHLHRHHHVRKCVPLIALYIGVAGMVGALLRYACGLTMEPLYRSGSFPLATLLINWLGCMALAWLLHSPVAKRRLSDRWRTTLGSGLIGSFTTFSAFSVETVSLINEQRWLTAVLYVGLSACGGLLFAWLGERIAHRLQSEDGTL